MQLGSILLAEMSELALLPTPGREVLTNDTFFTQVLMLKNFVIYRSLFKSIESRVTEFNSNVNKSV